MSGRPSVWKTKCAEKGVEDHVCGKPSVPKSEWKATCTEEWVESHMYGRVSGRSSVRKSECTKEWICGRVSRKVKECVKKEVVGEWENERIISENK